MRSQIKAGLAALSFLAIDSRPLRAEWTFAPPSPLDGGDDSFRFVDGTAFDDVWAVGVWQPAAFRCLAEHFDGATWTVVPTPDDPASTGRLYGVAAIAPDRAIAVGTHSPVGTTVQPLAMEWDGSEWILIPTPAQPGGRSFQAVDHTLTGATWVAGYEYGRAFIARRNGGSWNLEFAPPVGIYRNRFYALHARSDALGEFEILQPASRGRAVGRQFSGPLQTRSGPQRPSISRWIGPAPSGCG
jgi:hypothetical protein